MKEEIDRMKEERKREWKKKERLNERRNKVCPDQCDRMGKNFAFLGRNCNYIIQM
jgi:hypothetical protein